MGSFQNKTFRERYVELGDNTETQFKRWADAKQLRYYEYGFRRPPFKRFYAIPSDQIKHTPDFVCERSPKTKEKVPLHFFIECKAVGRDQIIKLKHNEVGAWEQWADELPIYLFVLDTKKERIALTEYTTVKALIEQGLSTGHFYDGGSPKPYWELPTHHLAWEAWEIVNENSG